MNPKKLIELVDECCDKVSKKLFDASTEWKSDNGVSKDGTGKPGQISLTRKGHVRYKGEYFYLSVMMILLRDSTNEKVGWKPQGVTVYCGCKGEVDSHVDMPDTFSNFECCETGMDFSLEHI